MEGNDVRENFSVQSYTATVTVYVLFDEVGDDDVSIIFSSIMRVDIYHWFMRHKRFTLKEKEEKSTISFIISHFETPLRQDEWRLNSHSLTGEEKKERCHLNSY